MIPAEFTDRQLVYCLFYLKRLAARGGDRPDASSKAELAAALAAAMTHAAQTFGDAAERAAAIEDANLASVAVETLAAEPHFSAERAIADIEGIRMARQASPPAKPRLSDAVATTATPEPVAPSPSTKAIMSETPPARPKQSAWKSGLIAAVIGLFAGMLGSYMMRGPSPLSLQAAVGDWRWEGGAKVTLGPDGRFAFNERPAGYYFAATNRDFILVHGNGRFIDYLSLSADGARLTGFSAAGAAINATRMR